MITKIQKWGNSLAIRIPKSFARDTHIQSGSTVDLSVQNSTLIVKPINYQEYSLEELVSKISEENTHNEIDTGEPLGKEVW